MATKASSLLNPHRSLHYCSRSLRSVWRPDYLHLETFFPHQTSLSSFCLHHMWTGVPPRSSLDPLLSSVHSGRWHWVSSLQWHSLLHLQFEFLLNSDPCLHVSLYTWMPCWASDLKTCKTSLVVFSPNPLFLCSPSPCMAFHWGTHGRNLQVICDYIFFHLIGTFYLPSCPPKNVCHNERWQIGFI